MTFYVIGDTGDYGPFDYDTANRVQDEKNATRDGCDFIVVPTEVMPIVRGYEVGAIDPFASNCNDGTESE